MPMYQPREGCKQLDKWPWVRRGKGLEVSLLLELVSLVGERAWPCHVPLRKHRVVDFFPLLSYLIWGVFPKRKQSQETGPLNDLDVPFLKLVGFDGVELTIPDLRSAGFLPDMGDDEAVEARPAVCLT